MDTNYPTGGSTLKKWMRIGFLSVIILVIYFVFIKEKFPIVEELPVVMQEEFEVVLNERLNSVSLEKDGGYENVAISINKGKTLYIANNVGHNITKFTVNQDKKELYIRKNIFDYKNGNNDKFQLIKVPYSEYKDITKGNKLSVYIDYGKGHELREYDLTNSEYTTLEQTDTTK
jgi:hypothetical protein